MQKARSHRARCLRLLMEAPRCWKVASELYLPPGGDVKEVLLLVAQQLGPQLGIDRVRSQPDRKERSPEIAPVDRAALRALHHDRRLAAGHGQLDRLARLHRRE